MLITDNHKRLGIFKKTYTGFGALSGYYYYFRLNKNSILKLKAPNNNTWSIVNSDILNQNFNYFLSDNNKTLNISIKNIIDKNNLYIYTFYTRLNGIDTFISFIINWNYQDYNKVYYNNIEQTINKEFYMGFADSIYYSIEFDNIIPTFSNNESHTTFTLNTDRLVLDINTNWNDIKTKPHLSKITSIVSRLNSFILVTNPEIIMSWTVEIPPENIKPEINLTWLIESPTVNNNPQINISWDVLQPTLSTMKSTGDISITATWTIT